jgi:hypothetical protein
MMRIFSVFLSFLFLLHLVPSMANDSVEVNVQNFVRAETDHYMARSVAQAGFGRLLHSRMPTPIEQQDVIRMNRDTIYSFGIFDLTQPVTITMPEADGRFQSMQVINQDHYTITVEHDPGTYRFTQEDAGTRYLSVIIRTFMDPNDEADIAAANVAQDMIKAQQSDRGEFDVPDWDAESLATVRGLLLALGATVPDSFAKAFGSKEEVDPIMHLLGTAAGWGGNPPGAAVYPGGFPALNDGKVPHAVTVKDVPVDGFWSITVYNEDGFMEKNDLGIYSFNGVTAEATADGSTTIHFGACEDGRVNCIPIMKGWNYVARLYRPRKEILDGSWTFPAASPLR